MHKAYMKMLYFLMNSSGPCVGFMLFAIVNNKKKMISYRINTKERKKKSICHIFVFMPIRGLASSFKMATIFSLSRAVKNKP